MFRHLSFFVLLGMVMVPILAIVELLTWLLLPDFNSWSTQSIAFIGTWAGTVAVLHGFVGLSASSHRRALNRGTAAEQSGEADSRVSPIEYVESSLQRAVETWERPSRRDFSEGNLCRDPKTAANIAILKESLEEKFN